MKNIYHYKAAIDDLNTIQILNRSISRFFPQFAIPARIVKYYLRKANKAYQRRIEINGRGEK